MTREEKFWAGCLILFYAIILACVTFCSGCASKVVYIERDDAAVRYELNGRKGWWLPDATMARLLEKAIRNDAEKKP